jgi:hypothetical protein
MGGLRRQETAPSRTMAKDDSQSVSPIAEAGRRHFRMSSDGTALQASHTQRANSGSGCDAQGVK